MQKEEVHSPLLHGQHKLASNALTMDIECQSATPGLALSKYTPSQLLLAVRGLQLAFTLVASMILVDILGSFTTDAKGAIVPRSWNFSCAVGLAFATCSLIWILIFLVYTVRKDKAPNPNLLNIVLRTLAYDMCCSILLFGAAIAVVPDSTGGIRAFEDEQKSILKDLLVQQYDAEFWSMLDSYKRVHRSVSAVCLFLTSGSSVISLLYIGFTQLQLKQ